MTDISTIHSIEHTLTKPEEFSQKVDILTQQWPSILDDFSKYYVFYHKNPENNEYQQLFHNIKQNMDSVQSQLFAVSTQLEENTHQINQELVHLDTLIQKEREKHRQWTSKVGKVKQKNNAVDELITEYKQMYDYGYLKNWGIFISILVAIYSISKIYGNTTNTGN
jgi:hypothetical protein